MCDVTKKNNGNVWAVIDMDFAANVDGFVDFKMGPWPRIKHLEKTDQSASFLLFSYQVSKNNNELWGFKIWTDLSR